MFAFSFNVHLDYKAFFSATFLSSGIKFKYNNIWKLFIIDFNIYNLKYFFQFYPVNTTMSAGEDWLGQYNSLKPHKKTSIKISLKVQQNKYFSRSYLYTKKILIYIIAFKIWEIDWEWEGGGGIQLNPNLYNTKDAPWNRNVYLKAKINSLGDNWI